MGQSLVIGMAKTIEISVESIQKIGEESFLHRFRNVLMLASFKKTKELQILRIKGEYKETNMNFELQPTLQDGIVRLEPLDADDFERLYAIACDPMIWEQHPNPDRYQRPIFETFFKGAIDSKAAFLIYDNRTNQLIGCTRYYELDETAKSIAIGYTFLAKSHWGTTYNRAAKTLLFNHAFKYVDKLIFHIGEHNIRSQMAITKLGAVKIGKVEMAYYGETPKYNFVYQINKADWVI